MITALMNSWFALLLVFVFIFILINRTHMCSRVAAPRPTLAGRSPANTHRSDKETRGNGSTRREEVGNGGGKERVNETKMERGRC